MSTPVCHVRVRAEQTTRVELPAISSQKVTQGLIGPVVLMRRVSFLQARRNWDGVDGVAGDARVLRLIEVSRKSELAKGRRSAFRGSGARSGA